MKNKLMAAVIAAITLPLAWLVFQQKPAQDSFSVGLRSIVDNAGGPWVVFSITGALGGWIGVSIYQNSARHRAAEQMRLHPTFEDPV